MKDGKKSTAEKLVYSAFDKVKEVTKEDPMVVFERAIENVIAVTGSRVQARWRCELPGAARGSPRAPLHSRVALDHRRRPCQRKAKAMADKLADEVIAASKNEGNAIKKKLDMHRMAEANRAFAHFCPLITWRRTVRANALIFNNPLYMP